MPRRRMSASAGRSVRASQPTAKVAASPAAIAAATFRAAASASRTALSKPIPASSADPTATGSQNFTGKRSAPPPSPRIQAPRGLNFPSAKNRPAAAAATAQQAARPGGLVGCASGLAVGRAGASDAAISTRARSPG